MCRGGVGGRQRLVRADPPADVSGLGRTLSRALTARSEMSAMQRAALGDIADPQAVAERLSAVLGPLVAQLPSGKGARAAEPAPGRTRRRPSIAVAAPLPPTPSGVADYTEFTVGYLAQLSDVTVCPLDLESGTAPPGARLRRLDAGVYLDR